MWHCPHCGAPQAESARCWVCRRSSTTCSTCRHFRRSLAADVGWCALDPKRRPLTGLELRGCWEQRLRPPDPALLEGNEQAVRRPAPRLRMIGDDEPWSSPARDFVPVELLGSIVVPSSHPHPHPDSGPPIEPAIPALAGDAEPGWAERTSLFGDPEA